MKKSPYYNRDIAPACEYCLRGRASQLENEILCNECGITRPDDSCGKFVYDPTKRKPHPLPVLNRYSPDDFRLD